MLIHHMTLDFFWAAPFSDGKSVGQAEIGRKSMAQAM